jgi:hypothetical protein
MNKASFKYPLVAVRAEDWSINDGPVDINHGFSLYEAWVVGFLIRETATFIVLTPELFDDNRCRRSQTIPKSAIRKRILIRKA